MPEGWRCVVVVSLLLSLAACGGASVTPTLNPTQAAAQAATLIAGLPTAEALTPQASRTPEPTLMPIVTVAPTATSEPTRTPAPTVEYTVKAGDSLLSIAFDHTTSMAAIMLLNDMGETQVVKLGQVLRLPSTPMWPGENLMWVIYIVRAGDTLTGIASQFGVRVDDLVKVNQLPNASAIRNGQTLVIPTTAPVKPPLVSTATAKPVAEAPTSAPEVVEAPTVVPDIAEAPPTAVAAPAVVLVDSVEMAGAKELLLLLYNQVRFLVGLEPLMMNAALAQAAQLHAEDNAQRGYGSHVGSDGSSTSDRIHRAGYVGRIYGENWAWGRGAENVFDMWFHQEAPSGPHRNNILSARYAEVGFGVAAANGGYYFIADFGAP